MGNKNYYEILGIKRNATLDDIVEAYKKLYSEWGDPNRPTPHGYTQKQREEKFKEIIKAYNVLINDNERRIYDDDPNSFEKGGSNYQEEEYLNDYYEIQREKDREKAIKMLEERMKENYISPLFGYDPDNPPLDPNLWKPYSNWKEKIKKSSDKERDIAVAKLVKAIEKFNKVESEREELVSKLQNDCLKEIEEKMCEYGIREEKLDSRLWHPHSDYIVKMLRMRESNQLEAFKNQILSAIEEVRRNNPSNIPNDLENQRRRQRNEQEMKRLREQQRQERKRKRFRDDKDYQKKTSWYQSLTSEQKTFLWIGIGSFAFFIILLLLVAFSGKRKRRRRYYY